MASSLEAVTAGNTLAQLAAKKVLLMALATELHEAEVGAASSPSGAGSGSGAGASGTPPDGDTSLLQQLASSQPPHIQQYLLDVLVHTGLATASRLSAFLLPSVFRLDVSRVPSCHLSVLAGLPMYCPSLQQLVLDGSSVTESVVIRALSGLTNLTHLSMRRCGNVSDSTVRVALSCSRRLQHLDLSACGEVTDDAFLGAGDRVACLRHLDLSRLPDVTHEGLAHLRAATGLTYLSLNQCSDVHGLPLLTHHLQYINLKGVSRLPSEVVAVALRDALSCLHTLKIPESSLTAAELLSILAGTPGPLGIRKLDLSWCEELSADAVAQLVLRCPELEHVALRTLPFTDAAAVQMATTCPQLVKLHLGRVSELSDAGVVAIAKACTRLTKLDLSWVEVSETAFAAILTHLPQVQVLTMAGCKRLSAGVVDVVRDAPFTTALRVLDLSWVNAVSMEVVEALLQHVPQATVMDYFGDAYTKDTVGNVPAMMAAAGDADVVYLPAGEW